MLLRKFEAPIVGLPRDNYSLCPIYSTVVGQVVSSTLGLNFVATREALRTKPGSG